MTVVVKRAFFICSPKMRQRHRWGKRQTTSNPRSKSTLNQFDKNAPIACNLCRDFFILLMMEDIASSSASAARHPIVTFLLPSRRR